jgi:enoyl-CoA hydratase
MTETADETLKVEVQGTLALVTLNRPKALNALTQQMRAKLSESLWSFARDPQVYAVALQSESPRAFSAGSDVREVIALARADLAAGCKTFADEYALNWQCECFSKPTVPLINGMVMGGGVGITQFGTHRVAGETYSFAMPETLIGLFPDVGVCHVLARLPDHVGMYLGLTGYSIGRAEAYALGLVTHCIDSAEFEAIKAALADTWPVDPVLDDRHREPGLGELAPYRAVIDRCFSAVRVEDILARLEGVEDPHRDWAQGVLADLRRRSPLSLKITHRHIREARARDLRQTLQADYRLAVRLLEGDGVGGGDFYEGVRASLIDKDGKPRWSPARLEDVSEVMLDDYFAPLGARELALPTRAEMQAMRA